MNSTKAGFDLVNYLFHGGAFFALPIGKENAYFREHMAEQARTNVFHESWKLQKHDKLDDIVLLLDEVIGNDDA